MENSAELLGPSCPYRMDRTITFEPVYGHFGTTRFQYDPVPFTERFSSGHGRVRSPCRSGDQQNASQADGEQGSFCERKDLRRSSLARSGMQNEAATAVPLAWS